MPKCTKCGTTHDVDSLVRHERGNLLRVHCPDCESPMGQYRNPSGR
ncbi:hypothetical protein [Halostella sp. PRR32]|nr:hypothetical protein [Halostella sp. PRR32]